MEPEKQTELESEEKVDTSSQSISSVNIEDCADRLKDLELSMDTSSEPISSVNIEECADRLKDLELSMDTSSEPISPVNIEECADSLKDRELSMDTSGQSVSSVSIQECADRLRDLELSNRERSKQCLGGARSKQNTDNTKPGQDVPKKYYGVGFPSAHIIQTASPLVFENKVDAIKAIRLFPEARFREFTSRKEAYHYASVPYSGRQDISFREYGEKSLFKPIRSQEMIQLQRFIESGDEALFLEQVWSNPRYLVSSGDRPTAMQAGTHYNALHIAAEYGQTGIFLSILYVIQDNQFLSTLYPKDDPAMIESRIQHLVDMYLNKPDKVKRETPLHVACKFGHESIVDIMLSYSQCDVQIQNKDGHCAKDLVCQHHPCDYSNHKEQMLAMFEDLFYVPIFRDDGHSFVGQPCVDSTVLVAATSHRHIEGSSAVYCAFAGPASLSQATNFYNILKTKKFLDEKESLSEMYLADPKKGLQRVGRILCKDFSLGWFEYWSIINSWLDMTAPEGLECLNKHLRKQEESIYVQRGATPPFINLITNFMEEFVEKIPCIVVKSRHLFLFHELQSLVKHMECFTKRLYSNEAEIHDIHEEIGHLLYLKLTNDNHSNLDKFQTLKLFLLSQLSGVGYFQKLKWKMLSCILKFAFYFQLSKTDIIILYLKKPVCNCDFAITNDSYVYSSRLCYYAVVTLRQEITNDLVQKYDSEHKKEIEESNQTLVIPVRGLPLSFLAIRNDDSYLTERDPDLPQSDDTQLCIVETEFLVLADRFNFSFRSLVVNYEHMLPFTSVGVFFDIFENAMFCFRQICEVNFYTDCHLIFLHQEFAHCLAFKMLTLPRKTVLKWKNFLGGSDFTSKMLEVALNREWLHFLCVTKQFCFVLEGKRDLPACTCTYKLARTPKSSHPVNCLVLLKRLRDLYLSAVPFINGESRPCRVESQITDKEVFVRGQVMSEEDIDIFQALTDARVNFNCFQHPYIFKWKSGVEAKLLCYN